MRPGTIVEINFATLTPFQRRTLATDKGRRFVIQGRPRNRGWADHWVLVPEDSPRARKLNPHTGSVYLPEQLIEVGHIEEAMR